MFDTKNATCRFRFPKDPCRNAITNACINPRGCGEPMSVCLTRWGVEGHRRGESSGVIPRSGWISGPAVPGSSPVAPSPVDDEPRASVPCPVGRNDD